MSGSLIGQAFEVMAHDEKVARAAVAIDDPILKQGLDLEAELFEGGAGPGLVRRHHRGHLLQSARLAEMENFGGEAAAEAGAAQVGGDQYANLADAAGPAGIVGMEAGVADQLAIHFGDDGHRGAAFDVGHPFIERGGFGDVSAQKEQVVVRERAGEAEQMGFIGRGHQAQFDLLAAGKREFPREVGDRFACLGRVRPGCLGHQSPRRRVAGATETIAELALEEQELKLHAKAGVRNGGGGCN